MFIVSKECIELLLYSYETYFKAINLFTYIRRTKFEEKITRINKLIHFTVKLFRIMCFMIRENYIHYTTFWIMLKKECHCSLKA